MKHRKDKGKGVKLLLWFSASFCIIAVLLSYVAQAQPPKKGDIIPNFGLRDIKGRMVFLNDYCGATPKRMGWKPQEMLIVSFFATWCKPCKKETGQLLTFYEKWKDQGLGILLIGYGKDQNSKNLGEFSEEKGITFPVLVDRTGIAGEKFGVTNIPRTVILNKSCQVVEDIHGALDNFEEILLAQARQLIPGAASASPEPGEKKEAAPQPAEAADEGELAVMLLDGAGNDAVAKDVVNLLKSQGFSNVTVTKPKEGKYPQTVVYYLEPQKADAEKISFLLGGVTLTLVKNGPPISVLIGEDLAQ